MIIIGSSIWNPLQIVSISRTPIEKNGATIGYMLKVRFSNTQFAEIDFDSLQKCIDFQDYITDAILKMSTGK